MALTLLHQRFVPMAVAALAALAIAGCSPTPSGDAAQPPASASPDKVESAASTLPPASTKPDKPAAIWTGGDQPHMLMWYDLLPEGEEDILMQLYDAFYENLEREMRGKQTFLTQQGASGTLDTAAIAEGSTLDTMPQIGTFNTVADLDGARVRIPGYVVPFDFSAKGRHKEFLAVPYQGACLHTPPPPPNQIIYVTSADGVRIPDVWGAYWLEGVLSTTRHENDIGNAAYSLTLTSITAYE